MSKIFSTYGTINWIFLSQKINLGSYLTTYTNDLKMDYNPKHKN